jgi:hypothetical protein
VLPVVACGQDIRERNRGVTRELIAPDRPVTQGEAMGKRIGVADALGLIGAYRLRERQESVAESEGMKSRDTVWPS